MGFVKPAIFLFSTNALVTCLCYGVNTVFPLIPSQLKIPGTIGVVSLAATVGFLYTSLFRPKHVTKSAYFPAVVFLFMTSFDLTAVVDQMILKDVLVPHYSHCGDPMIENVWLELVVCMDGSLLHLLNFILFYRMFNGLSWRSLELFNVSAWLSMCPPSLLPFLSSHPIQFLATMNVFHVSWPLEVLLPCLLKMTLELPRLNNLGQDENGNGKNGSGSGKVKQQNQQKKATGFFLSFLFKLTAFVLTLETIALIVYHVGVTHNEELSPFTGRKFTPDYLKKHNPIFFFQPVKGLPAFGLAHLYSYAVVVLPTLLINLIYIFRRTGPLPSFLWDINVFSAGLVYIGQGYFVLGAFYPSTPKEFQADPSNLIFWILNLTPFITCLVNILVLTPFRKEVHRTGARTGTGDSKKKR